MVLSIENADAFNSLIKENKVVLDFYATWCGPCRVIAPKIEKFAEKYTTIAFAKLDVDEVPDIAEKSGIRAMPTFHIYKDGVKVAEVVGADPVKLEAAIAANA
ncbi:hypothetical protein HDU67_008230 [Dinochytrium kinnereticum]|nr:hypothetical protein HDU67_008230 [Dinochytrium kinnereticum]